MPILVSQENKVLKTVAQLKEYDKIKSSAQSARAYLMQNTPEFERKRQDALLMLTPCAPLPSMQAFPPAQVSPVADEVEEDESEGDGEGEEEGGGEGEDEDEVEEED